MGELGGKFADYWGVVVDVWDNGFLGIDVGRILIAVLILLGFLVLRSLFAKFVVARMQTWTRRTKTDLDDKLFAALEGPIRFIPVTLGIFFAVDYLNLTDAPQEVADKLIRSLIAYTLFWGLFNAVTPLSSLFERLKVVLTQAMIDWLVKALKAAVVLVGGATILEMWGIQVAPILAGLGLFGVAVALGAQDLFKNLIAGILILAERRFQTGDWVKVDGVVEGTVETIGFRSTRVRRFDKAPVYVPNAKLSDNAVTNFSAMTNRRIYWKIGVVYATTVPQLRAIRDAIEAYIADNPDFEQPPKVARFVRIDAFNDSSIDIMIYTFTKTTNWGEWLAVKEQLAYKIKEIVLGAGSDFAFPSQSLYVETVPGEVPEVFAPPAGSAALPKPASAPAPSVGATDSVDADGE